MSDRTTERWEDKSHWLAQRFDENRGRLRRVAYRMLGSVSEADDALQEAWLKLSRAEGEVNNLSGWLTTVVARVCLDMLRSRASRREEPLAAAEDISVEANPEEEIALAEAMGPALLILLETLSPAERVAFVLHDMFSLSFEEIAPIINRNPAAARKLASRARRRVQGAETTAAHFAQHRELVGAFLAASRDGDFSRLLAVLSADAVLQADELAVRTAAENRRHGAPILTAEIRGAVAVAETFKGRARAAVAAIIDGEPGAVWAMGAQVRAAFFFTFDRNSITAIEVIMDPHRLAELVVEMT